MKSIESILRVRRGNVPSSFNVTDKDLKAELIHELTDGYWWHYADSATDFDPLLITYEVESCQEHDYSHEDWIPVSEDAKLLCEISQEKYLRGWGLDIVMQYYTPGARIEEVINVNIQE